MVGLKFPFRDSVICIQATEKKTYVGVKKWIVRVTTPNLFCPSNETH